MARKQKTNKAAAKRFIVKKSGKIFRYKRGKRHLLRSQPTDVKRQKRGVVELDSTDKKKVVNLLKLG